MIIQRQLRDLKAQSSVIQQMTHSIITQQITIFMINAKL